MIEEVEMLKEKIKKYETAMYAVVYAHYKGDQRTLGSAIDRMDTILKGQVL